MTVPAEESGRLHAEIRRLAEERDLFMRYIRAKTDELLVLMKCPTLNADALGDLDLIGYDPIGTIATSFSRVLENLNETNQRLRNEVGERARVEEELRDFFDNAMEFIQTVSPDGKFLYVNRTWLETLGYRVEDVDRLTLFDVVPSEELLAKDGGRILVEGNATPRRVDGECVAVRIICHDVTARKLHVEEHLKAEKLESIGVLAGGIAHDFNNLLTGILGNISMARIRSASPTDIQGNLDRAEKACLRARELTRQLLTFSEGGAPVRKTMPLAGILRNAADRFPGGESVRVEIDLPADLAPVEIDEAQIAQVFDNIVANAEQAMPGGGTIRLSAGNVEIGPGDPLPLEPGPFVLVSVEDTGVGIPKESIHKIFDPFYTTKAGGSGLGLATAYSVLKQHGGLITVDSRRGHGTTFRIYLPASAVAAADAAAPREPPPREKTRVLVMDDEAMVRDVAVEFLGHLGYDAVSVEGGEDALEEYRSAKSCGRPYSAVIMDLTIPGRPSSPADIRPIR
ncbi:MAG: PAS domain S-box protein [Deltaproteobacteria bacterium]|nr:PAS domain S-box protein [Deltaproteobacteria bacterium]